MNGPAVPRARSCDGPNGVEAVHIDGSRLELGLSLGTDLLDPQPILLARPPRAWCRVRQSHPANIRASDAVSEFVTPCAKGCQGLLMRRVPDEICEFIRILL